MRDDDDGGGGGGGGDATVHGCRTPYGPLARLLIQIRKLQLRLRTSIVVAHSRSVTIDARQADIHDIEDITLLRCGQTDGWMNVTCFVYNDVDVDIWGDV